MKGREYFYVKVLFYSMRGDCRELALGAEKPLAEPLESIRLYVERHIWISISCPTLNRATIKALALTCTWKSTSCPHTLWFVFSSPFAPAAIILTVLFPL